MRRRRTVADNDTTLRAVHDVTQSVWLGGALMGAVAIDAATRAVPNPSSRIHVAGAAWQAWHRVSTPAIAIHLLAGAGLTVTNGGRLIAQEGAETTMAIRTGLTGGALLAELTARRLGATLGARHATVRGSTTPATATDEETAKLQKRLRRAQWTTVALTAAMVAVGARMGEEQRPRALLRGVADQLGLAA
jgi:hypothetical protein